jgi:transcriptional regulator with XRE-family HTH domain
MKSKDLRNKLLQSSESFREEFYKRDLALEISHMIVRERIKKGLTQFQLAELMGTQQPAIARIEKGSSFPDLEFLERVSKALQVNLFIEFRESETYTTDWAKDSLKTTLKVSPYVKISVSTISDGNETPEPSEGRLEQKLSHATK